MNEMISRSDLAGSIDHTLLKPEAVPTQIAALCREALDYSFASVCVNSVYVSQCRGLIPSDSPVKVCSVVGFPLGAMAHAAKASETSIAIAHGANEIDMVADLGAIAAQDWDRVHRDVEAVRKTSPAVTLKVILETSLIGLEAAAIAARIAADAGADYVKTSTGFHASGGATVEAVRTLAAAVDGRAKVKASGGIRDLATTIAMLEAGAFRIGASASVAIVSELAD